MTGVLNQVVHVLAEQFIRVSITSQTEACRIAESTTTLEIDPINRLGRRFENEAEFVLAITQQLRGRNALSDVLFDAHEVGDLPHVSAYRGNGHFLGVQTSILAAADIAVPDLSGSDGLPNIGVNALSCLPEFNSLGFLPRASSAA